jgi:queuine/archaeosine tRNA-ribosyltransferase
MARICIFHDRDDLQLAGLCSAAARLIGHDPWIANSDSGGNWRDDVARALRRPDCLAAVVIWSDTALQNQIVIEEAEEAVRVRRSLLSILRDDVQLPLGLRNTPRLLLRDVNVAAENIIEEIADKLTRVIESAGQESHRLSEIDLHGRKLKSPAFVFSVSSFETQISPARTLELLALFTPPALLVSAFDLLGVRDNSPDSMPTPEILEALTSKDTSIFLDSGNYEAYRFDNKFWQRNPWLLREAITRLRWDAIFSHDRITDVSDTTQVKPAMIAEQVVKDVERDRSAPDSVRISPIIHAPRASDGKYLAEFLPEICASVARSVRPPLIAIAERELGNGILARAKRVRSIRKRLDRLGHHQPLHILGTGNPLSMLILAFAGGDAFDGLEWCRTVVDAETMRLHHFHHFDLFIDQRREIDDDYLRDYLEREDEVLSAKAKAVLHNLYFFQRFTKEVQAAHDQGSYEEIFARYLPSQFGRLAKRLNDAEVP